MPYPVPEAERRTHSGGQFWNNLAQTWPARAANALYEAATLPGDVYAGRVDPTSDDAIRRSADLAGFAAGGGLTAALGRKGTSLGTFGGKAGVKRGEVLTVSDQNIGNLYRTFKAGPHEGSIRYGIIREPAGQITTDVSFGFPQGVALPKDRQAVLATVFDDVGNFINRVRPKTVQFSAERAELEPLYRRVGQRLAEKFGGQFDEELFEAKGIVKVHLPNARKFTPAQPWKKYGAPQGGKPWEKYERQ